MISFQQTVRFFFFVIQTDAFGYGAISIAKQITPVAPTTTSLVSLLSVICRFQGFNFPGACLLSSLPTGVQCESDIRQKSAFLSSHDIIHLFNSSSLSLTSQSSHRPFFSFTSLLSLWCSFPTLFLQMSSRFCLCGRQDQIKCDTTL
jgi:hypothetical protein